jgi:8-oxo-dGTP pyrophosphatase MutT (NUDIX family)
MSLEFSALFEQATLRREPRVPMHLGGHRVGSVAAANLPALAVHAPLLSMNDAGVRLDAPNPTEALARINRALRQAGLVSAWRDEIFPVLPEGARAGDAPLALIERAASRFWGTLTFGAHCNGYVADVAGQPTHLWIACRSASKATDPGKLDNLVGGGVPHGQTPFQALVREGFEEAGLNAATMQHARAASVLHLRCDIAEGLMNEHLHSFDLRLPADVKPVNQDGEVAEWHCLPIDAALVHAERGEMTLDAALVTLDFVLRHRLLSAAQTRNLSAAMQRLYGA